ncbi:glycosyltransferase [Hyunsoonleella sp. SJ7]|uniref:Glycosyltransferase n=1 Tax=Hyunsoonleella aquatilis TaxID=2762758 RepID=A0A923HCQ8_9FLAO|nr:glycosyltransferase [Hyunsoonleella aquatilis]MBC3759029.1 glycosyltransferase [Hyunsoonleella aquatilis]
MLLSILIPMYNTEKYIGNCLESLIQQDVDPKDYEIIVIDDGSTDNSASVVQSYIKKTENIKLHRQSNAGITVTSNRLLELATGKYIYKIDSDDYVAHHTFGTLLRIMEERNLEVLGFDSCETEQLDLYQFGDEIDVENIEVQTGVEYWAQAKNPRSGANWYIVNREFLVKNNRTFELEDNPMCDTPFTFQLFALVERFTNLPNVIHRYVQVPSSGSNNRNVNHLKRRIFKRKALVYKLRDISDELEEKRRPRFSGMIESLKFWSDVNVYFLFQKFLYVNISIPKINLILKELEDVDAYPMENFTGDKCFSKRHELTTKFFNNKSLFFLMLYPLRLLVRLKIVELNFR